MYDYIQHEIYMLEYIERFLFISWLQKFCTLLAMFHFYYKFLNIFLKGNIF